jgi:hypothetical protein
MCLQACTAVSDCVSPNVCNASGQCVAAPSGGGGSSGGCATAPGACGDATPLVIAGLALFAASRRRRTPALCGHVARARAASGILVGKEVSTRPV